MKSISALVIGKQWDIVIQRLLHQSFNKMLSKRGEKRKPKVFYTNLSMKICSIRRDRRMKKKFLIIGSVIIVLLVMIGFITPLLNAPLSKEQIIWRTRIDLLSIYARELNNFFKDEQRLPDMDNFKKILNTKLTYQTSDQWKSEFKKAYGENISPLDVFQIVSFNDKKTQWGILEIDPNSKHSNKILIKDDGAVYLIKKIASSADDPDLLHNPL